MKKELLGRVNSPWQADCLAVTVFIFSMIIIFTSSSSSTIIILGKEVNPKGAAKQDGNFQTIAILLWSNTTNKTMALPPPCQQSLNGASKIPYLQGYNKVLQHSTKGDVREVH